MKTINTIKYYSLNYMLLCSIILFSIKMFSQTGGAVFEYGPDMNRARIVPLATTLSNGNIAIFGGREYGFVSCYYTDIYDPVTNTFTELNMQVPRDNASLVALQDGRYLLVGGGYDWGIPAYGTNEIYNPVDNTFTLAGTMVYNRMQSAAAQLNNGNVLIIGGWYDDYAAANSEIYHIETNTYTASGVLNAPRSQAVIIPTTDGGAILAGGYTTYGAEMITSVEYYNAETGIFSVVSNDIIVGDPGWTMWGRTRAIADDKMMNGKYVFLAYRNTSEPEYALLYFDPSTKTFEKKFNFVLSEHPSISGGIYDMILDKNGNYVYLLATVSGSDPVEVALIAVDLTNEVVYIPENNYVLSPGEYLFPSLAFIPSTGEILITGISASPSDYFNATSITYLLKPEHSVGIEEEMILPNAITCFPNPTTGIFNVKINIPIEGELSLSVFDMDGREVSNVNMNSIQKSSNLYSLNNLDLGSGLYIIKIRSLNNAVYTTTLVVTK